MSLPKRNLYSETRCPPLSQPRSTLPRKRATRRCCGRWRRRRCIRDTPVAVHETHASWVFVVGERAYKVKKPVALGFLDYSTLALRHRACREEVRVNQALAPGLYLGVRAIVKGGSGFRIASEEGGRGGVPRGNAELR